MTTQSINQAGLDLIKRFEGLRLEAYQDTGGVWSVGFGHTRGVKQGDKITSAAADIYLAHDLSDAEGAVNQLVESDLNTNQFSALVCLVFNIGETQFAASTLLKLLNAGDYEGAAGEFHKWNHDNGQVSAGLTRRRQAEEELFRRVIKPLAQSKTIQAGSIAVPTAAIGCLDQLDSVRDALTTLTPYWKYAGVILSVLTLLSAMYIVWRRIHDHVQGAH